jgi:6-phosphogluconolactonase
MMNQPFKIEIFNNYQEIADFVRSIIVGNAVSERYNIALSGGNTPRSIYSLLSEYKKPYIPWEIMRFFWGDERCVPPDNKDSNYLMTKESLFDKIDISNDQVFRIKGEKNPEEEKERYRQIILSNTNGIFDLVLLGLGTDGHTASIFPNQMDLLTTEEVCDLAVHPDSGQVRITLSGSILNASRKILFLVTGSEKSQVVYEILYHKGEWNKYPASYINPVNGEIIWILDKKAAARI